MINVKAKVYSALTGVSAAGVISDGYPKDWVSFPTTCYKEEQNDVFEWTDGAEQKARLRYTIDIWNDDSTSAAALAVDSAISALGLVRTACRDLDDPAGYKHKQMTYEGIIDVNTEQIYHNNLY